MTCLILKRGEDVYKRYVKRFLDVIMSIVALIILSPLFLILVVLIRAKLGGPAIFKQQRAGYKGKKFTLYKFRTMTNEKDENGNLLPDEDRLTPFGERLRATSLDELPELWNIIKGDMSIIGPRPFVVEYLDRYTEEQNHRHDVKPGLSGLAQVNGRNMLGWIEKFNYDLIYVNNISFSLDVKIFFKTIPCILKSEGIHSKNSVTMEEFKGERGKL